MVSVKKKENVISSFSQLKLKIQLMSNFTLITFFSCFVISILIILFIQEKITSRILEDSTDYVKQRVELEMKNVLVQMVMVFQSSLFNVGQLIYELETVVKDAFKVNKVFADSGIFTTFPSYDFSTSSDNNKASRQISACNVVQTTVEDASICVVSSSLDPPPAIDYDRYFIGSFLELDKYVLNLYKTEYLGDKIFRVIIQTYSQDQSDLKRNIFKIYPPSYIDENEQTYYYSRGKYYVDQQKNMQTDSSKGDKIFVQGPYEIYLQSTSETKSVMSLSITFKGTGMTVPTSTGTQSEDIYFHIRVEILMQVVDEFVKSHSFRSKNEIVILNKNGTFVYITDYWKVKKSSTHVFDAGMQNYSGLDETTFQNLKEKQEQIVVNKLNKEGDFKDYLITPVLLNNTYDANIASEYLQTGVNDALNDNYFIVLLYGEKEQMYEITQKIEKLTGKQESITIRICVVTSFITIVIVYVATYLVSVKVDRPLRVLINIIGKLNNSVTIKQNALIKIKDQLEYQEKVSEYQVKELVIQFKLLIEKLINRSKDNKTNLIKPTIDYPLNELETNFVKKTKGQSSEFDWEKLIIDIQNRSKFPDKKKPGDKSDGNEQQQQQQATQEQKLQQLKKQQI